MKTDRKVKSLMLIIAATLFVFAMAAPVMADRLVTLQGKFTEDGKFVADSGREFWLDGPHVWNIEKRLDKKVSITGMLKENNDNGKLGTFYFGPSIEVYRYEWVKGPNNTK
jgi:hypothetical protein